MDISWFSSECSQPTLADLILLHACWTRRLPSLHRKLYPAFTHPACDPPGIPDHQRMIRHMLGDNCPCSDKRISPNRYATQNRRICTKCGASLDQRRPQLFHSWDLAAGLKPLVKTIDGPQ